MFAYRLKVPDLLVLLVIGVLFVGPRLPQIYFAGWKIVRAFRVTLRAIDQSRPSAVPVRECPVPPWLLTTLAWLWREFYFWTIDDWE